MVHHDMALITNFYLISVSLLIYGCSSNRGVSEWGYGVGDFYGPKYWKLLYKTCGGMKQSPINIVTKRTIFRGDLLPVKVFGILSDAKVKLEAHTTSLYLKFTNEWTITFNGFGRFKPIAIHWHWGRTNNQGSEHTIDGHRFAMEGHLVTYDADKYPNPTVAAASPNGIYVFAIFYELGRANHVFSQFEPHMKEVIRNGQAIIPEINPRDLLPENLSEYYRYQGSLTTPPCTENVVWTIFPEVQTISEDQLNKFRSLKFGPPSSGPMGDNFRPAFPSSNRFVYVTYRV